jgi:hypothetical protein
MQPINKMLVAFAFVFAALNCLANNYSSVAVNGEVLTREQLYVLQVQLGTAIPAGNYLLDGQGCWLNLTSGLSGCVGSVSTHSRYGSGERTSDGSWNQYSQAAEMGVGGTSDGCIYTTQGWSNC